MNNHSVSNNSIYLGKRKSNYENIKEKRKEDMMSKLRKLNKEFKIKMIQNNENLSPEIKFVGESLNDYTNELLDFYKNSYFHIKNKEKKKKFLDDLKLIISIYGKFDNLFKNIYKTNNILRKGIGKLPKRNIQRIKEKRKEETFRSNEINKFEKLFIIKRLPRLPKTDTKQSHLQIKVQSKQSQATSINSQKSKKVSNNNIEDNLLNNSSNCYRNSVLHLLVSILKDEQSNNNFDAVFKNNLNDICETKMNLKNLLIALVNKKYFHPLSILTTYNSFLTEVSPKEHNYNNTFNINGIRFTMRHNNRYITNYNELCEYYPNLNKYNQTHTSYNFYEDLKTNLKNNIEINVVDNKNKDIIKMIIDNRFMSYASADIYLSQLLDKSKMFKEDFLNKIKITYVENNKKNYTYILYPNITTTTNTNTVQYNNFQNYFNDVIKNYNIQNIQNNQYLMMSSIYLLIFKNYDFNQIYIINSQYYYQITDIIYTSRGHYVSLNMRNGDWYLYNDVTNSKEPEKLGRENDLFNLSNRNFYPNIFLLKKIDISS